MVLIVIQSSVVCEEKQIIISILQLVCDPIVVTFNTSKWAKWVFAEGSEALSEGHSEDLVVQSHRVRLWDIITGSIATASGE